VIINWRNFKDEQKKPGEQMFNEVLNHQESQNDLEKPFLDMLPVPTTINGYLEDYINISVKQMFRC
jgi:hypothetical protein